MSPRPVPEALKLRLKELPEKPGVYFFKDREGKALYIGKALSLKKRVAGHFRFYGESFSKEGMMLSQIRRVDVLETPTEAEALLLEASLVKEMLPKYNKMLRDDKSFPYLKITAEEYPRLVIARGRKADGGKYFGPYTNVRLLRQALKMLRREFPLRTCRTLPKKVCLQYHLGLCGGPCEGIQLSDEYHQTVKELSSFLEGRRDALVRNLSKRMKAHSAQQEYEKAQALYEAIRALSAVPSGGRGKKTPSEVLSDFQTIFSLPSLPRRIECFDISNIQGSEAVGSMVVFSDGEPSRKDYRRFRIRTVQGIDDYKMMQKMRMSIYDINDVAYDAFLLNGFPNGIPWTAPVKVGEGLTLNVTFCANDVVQFGVALVEVTLVICKVCPLLAALRFAEVKLAAPDPFATTPVTAVCATPLMV